MKCFAILLAELIHLSSESESNSVFKPILEHQAKLLVLKHMVHPVHNERFVNTSWHSNLLLPIGNKRPTDRICKMNIGTQIECSDRFDTATRTRTLLGENLSGNLISSKNSEEIDCQTIKDQAKSLDGATLFNHASLYHFYFQTLFLFWEKEAPLVFCSQQKRFGILCKTHRFSRGCYVFEAL